jgi:sodium/bile acid cotransporter 7
MTPKICPVSLAAALLFLATVHSVAGQNTMTDAEKKQTVYDMYAGYKKDFPAVIDVSPEEAAALLEQDRVVFVDTRKPEEMAVSMLPGAVSQNDFVNHLETYGDKSVVAYCTVSYRSGVFAREMAEKGITVKNLVGGILAWTLEGGKVYDSNGLETKRIHVYGDRWDYAPAGYETVKFSLWQQLF